MLYWSSSIYTRQVMSPHHPSLGNVTDVEVTAYAIAYNALTYVYMVEIFPYYVRTKGLSWFQLFGRGANLFGNAPLCLLPYLIPQAVN